MKFRPLHDRVVVKRIDAEQKSAGGIIIPDTAKEKPQEGEVVAVGPGARNERGELVAIDVKPGDLAVLFDVRRYDPAMLDIAHTLSRRKAHIVLITDEWLSPITRHARYCLPCRTETGRTWDANAVLLGLVEAIIARVTELGWKTASERIGELEGE